jgi:hypothetical protein
VAFAASRSQSFFVISSAAAKRTIVDPAKHARSIQKKPTADLWPVWCDKLGSGEAWVTLAARKQPFLLSPLKMYAQLGAACFSSFHQYRQHGEQNGH